MTDWTAGLLALLSNVSHALADNRALLYSFLAVAAYASVALAVYAFTIRKERAAERELAMILRQSSNASEALLALNKSFAIGIDPELLRQDAPGSPYGGDRDWRNDAAAGPTAQHTALGTTRIGTSLRSLLANFMSTAKERHLAEGIRPSFLYFLRTDLGSPIDIDGLYDTLVRLSLLLTFGGVAAVLFLAGAAVEGLTKDAVGLAKELVEKGSPTSGTTPQDMMGPVKIVIASSANKFWITVFGYGAANLMLITHQLVEMRRKQRLRAICTELDAFLALEDTLSFARDPEDDALGLGAEKQKIFRAISRNVESLSKMTEAFDVELLGGMKSIVADSKAGLEAVVEKLREAFSAVFEQGLAVQVSREVSRDLKSVMEVMVGQLSESTKRTSELIEMLQGLIVAAAPSSKSEAHAAILKKLQDNAGAREAQPFLDVQAEALGVLRDIADLLRRQLGEQHARPTSSPASLAPLGDIASNDGNKSSS